MKTVSREEVRHSGGGGRGSHSRGFPAQPLHLCPTPNQTRILFIQTGSCAGSGLLLFLATLWKEGSVPHQGLLACQAYPNLLSFSRASGGNPVLRPKSSFQTISEASKGDKGLSDNLSSAVFPQVKKKWEFKEDSLSDSTVLLIGDLWIILKCKMFTKSGYLGALFLRDKMAYLCERI